MRVQYENLLISNFLFYLDHHLCTKGQAYANHGSLFYPVDSLHDGFYTYNAPFSQFVCDQSIEGSVNPNILSGVYIDNRLVYPGQNDFVSISPYQGQLNFSSPIDLPISGNYAVKEFNIYITNEGEEELLFESRFDINPKTHQNPEGLPPSVKTFPAIFIKDIGGKNVPLAWGGTDLTLTNLRAIVLADSAYKLDAVCSIFRDLIGKYVPLIPEGQMPFDAMGAHQGGFNYLDKTNNISDTSRISDVVVSRIPVNKGDFVDLKHDVFPAFVDFIIEKPFERPHMDLANK